MGNVRQHAANRLLRPVVLGCYFLILAQQAVDLNQDRPQLGIARDTSSFSRVGSVKYEVQLRMDISELGASNPPRPHCKQEKKEQNGN